MGGILSGMMALRKDGQYQRGSGPRHFQKSSGLSAFLRVALRTAWVSIIVVFRTPRHNDSRMVRQKG
jgi:hypothetical protein